MDDLLKNYDAVESYLLAAYIPRGHRAHEFLTKEELLFFQKIVQVEDAYLALVDIGNSKEDLDL